MWTFLRVIPADWNVIAVQAPIADPIGGFSWWPINNQDAPASAINQAAEVLSQFIDQAPDHYRLTPSFLVALGFSQGAGVLSVLLFRQMNRFKGLALLAGFIIPPEAEPQSIENKTKIFIGHGTADETIALNQAEWGRDFLKSRHFDVTFVTDEVGHKVGASTTRALKEWLLTL